MISYWRKAAWLPASLAVLLAGCSTVTDYISPAEVDPPAELQDIQELVQAKTLWSADVGAGSDDKRLHLVPTIVDGRLYVAEADGQVRALDAKSGATLWSIDLDAPLSGGPGVGDGLVVMGTTDAEVIALSSVDGTLRWRSRVTSEVLSTPAIAYGRVVARSIDGQITGLDANTGERVWGYSRKIPVLTLRGSSSPVISGTSALCGLAGGRLLALDIATGAVNWETIISIPGGRSELQRIADVDGDPLISDGIAYVATYQGEVAAVGESTGSVLWRRKFSSYSGMATDRERVFAADADGFVWAMNVDNGGSFWKQEALRNRQLSDVAYVNGVVAVGDFEGYVHFLSPETGELIGRTRVGSDPITRGMLVHSATLYVMGEGGDLEALQVSASH